MEQARQYIIEALYKGMPQTVDNTAYKGMQRNSCTNSYSTIEYKIKTPVSTRQNQTSLTPSMVIAELEPYNFINPSYQTPKSPIRRTTKLDQTTHT